ncbi:hypothetical protein N7474_000319 [Penicillium riverlandense]|uniref:uncharacterized protein n=1 Tax=Penicillium riverlandense TaxID=1903569 RepID=UPI002547140D|nr:uncharacterized protein N7474_000319 [Penicillium riverlandense]KAJ5832008.1 hypothetical protein N7474_000319 [Penicillium riverlandense]
MQPGSPELVPPLVPPDQLVTGMRSIDARVENGRVPVEITAVHLTLNEVVDRDQGPNLALELQVIVQDLGGLETRLRVAGKLRPELHAEFTDCVDVKCAMDRRVVVVELLRGHRAHGVGQELLPLVGGVVDQVVPFEGGLPGWVPSNDQGSKDLHDSDCEAQVLVWPQLLVLDDPHAHKIVRDLHNVPHLEQHAKPSRRQEVLNSPDNPAEFRLKAHDHAIRSNIHGCRPVKLDTCAEAHEILVGKQSLHKTIMSRQIVVQNLRHGVQDQSVDCLVNTLKLEDIKHIKVIDHLGENLRVVCKSPSQAEWLKEIGFNVRDRNLGIPKDGASAATARIRLQFLGISITEDSRELSVCKTLIIWIVENWLLRRTGFD